MNTVLYKQNKLTANIAMVIDNNDDDIDELLDYVADVDDEVFDNEQVSLRDRFRIHKNYTKLTM